MFVKTPTRRRFLQGSAAAVASLAAPALIKAETQRTAVYFAVDMSGSAGFDDIIPDTRPIDWWRDSWKIAADIELKPDCTVLARCDFWAKNIVHSGPVYVIREPADWQQFCQDTTQLLRANDPSGNTHPATAIRAATQWMEKKRIPVHKCLVFDSHHFVSTQVQQNATDFWNQGGSMTFINLPYDAPVSAINPISRREHLAELLVGEWGEQPIRRTPASAGQLASQLAEVVTHSSNACLIM